MPAWIVWTFVVLIGICSWQTPTAVADTSQTFAAPSIKNVRVDWCRNWAQGCGGPAAQLYCREKGFDKALSWSIDPNVGARGIPTLVFGDGRLCREPTCSAFRVIVCSRASPNESGQNVTTVPNNQKAKAKPAVAAIPAMKVTELDAGLVRFDRPQIKQLPLDLCKRWRRECGKPAADLFCKDRGFEGASVFAAETKASAREMKTVVFGDGRICEGRHCRPFRSITCTSTVAPSGKVAQTKPPKPPLAAAQESKKVAITAAKTKFAAFAFTKMTSFKPLGAKDVAFNWVKTLELLHTYPAGAQLYNCGSGDCSVPTTFDFEIDAVTSDVYLTFNVSKVPHAEGTLWQVGYLPFPAFANASAADLAPPGLVLSGQNNYLTGTLTFKVADAVKKLPPGAKNAKFHIRAIPVTAAGHVIGQPSNVMSALYGVKLPPQEPYEIYSKSEVPGSAPRIRLVSFGFEPFKSVERWPPGCKTWEELDKERKDRDILDDIGDVFSDIWNFASETYQWAKDQVINLASIFTLNLIPEEVFVLALDAAMVSMGIPPDIPNLDQLMKEGVDGLAKEMAEVAVSHIPAVDIASSVGSLAADLTIEAVASMTEAELRERLAQEIEKASRDAILAAANEMQKQVSGSGKGKQCTGKNFPPVFKVTVVNDGAGDVENVEINASAAPVYRGGNWIVSLQRGETTTLVAVGDPLLPAGPYSYPLLTIKQRHDEDVKRWYSEVLLHKNASLSVDVTGALMCLGGDPTSAFCDRERVSLHSSPPQMVTSHYNFP